MRILARVDPQSVSIIEEHDNESIRLQHYSRQCCEEQKIAIDAINFENDCLRTELEAE